MGLTSNLTAEPRAAKDVAPFLKQLRAMLDDEHPAVLRWTANGRAFEIVDMEQMMDHVLPKYFKHRKYTSFQRQLNYFNFRKWTKSKATLCTFSNEYFRRDQPELAWRITRKKSVHNATIQLRPSPRSLPPVPSVESAPGSPVQTPPAPLSEPLPVVITVPETSCQRVLSNGPFPSPTDLDMVLKTHDFGAHAIEPTSMAVPPPEMHEFEWIDALFPCIGHIDDDAYTPYLYPVPPPAFGSALLHTAHLHDYVAL